MSSSSLLGKLEKGLVFVVSAPAGTGKTTLARMLVDEFPDVVENISYTTRKSRPGEVSGVDYHFITEQEFQRKVDGNEFLEHVELYGNYYGTSIKSLRLQQEQGKHVIMVIDTQGVMLLKNKFPAIFIFVAPPSMEILRERLLNRQTESPKVIEERLAWAEKELEASLEYDYCIVNDDLDRAYQILRSILIAETHRIRREKD